MPSFLAILLIVLSFIAFEVIFADRFLPRTYVGDTSLFYLNKPQAADLLRQQFEDRANGKLQFNYDNQTFTVDLATASAQIDADQSISQAFPIGHEESNWGEKLVNQFNFLIRGGNVTPPSIRFNADQQIELINQAISQPAQNALISLYPGQATSSASIRLTNGKDGLQLDKDNLHQMIYNYLAYGSPTGDLPTKALEPDITNEEVSKAKLALESAQAQPVTLTFDTDKWILDSQTLFSLMDLSKNRQSLIDKDKLSGYLADLALKIDQPVVEPSFNFDPGTKRVTLFKPAQEGRALDIDKTATLISSALEGTSGKTIELPVKTVEPKIKATEAENFGIKELLAEGVSNFAGSIPNRAFNVGLAASRINGVIVPPGEEFSFDNSIGDIDAASGYKQAYVIKSGRTVLDDGGGVCQVSTTVYRAALKAGLPITARTAHAYRVGYYEQGFPPGLDATIFSPSVDLKFRNDTPANILVQTSVIGTSLYVDLYGTSDGRVAYLSTPVVTSVTPAPPELRQDDPTLAKGTVKQVDFAAAGANVYFTRTVKRNGETLINETVHSNFRPWQAVFLVGTKEG